MPGSTPGWDFAQTSRRSDVVPPGPEPRRTNLTVASRPLVELAIAYRARRTGDIANDVALFARLLRAAAVPVPMVAVLNAVRAIEVVRLDRRADVETALGACLVSSRDEEATFRAVFGYFWSAEEVATFGDLDESIRTQSEDRGVDVKAIGIAGVLQGSHGRRPAGEPSRRATYSRGAQPAQPFTLLVERDPRMDEPVRRLTRALATGKNHRRRLGSVGDLVDVRDSLRHNLRHGEELLVLRRSRRRPERARLVVLCDVSSSMLPYTPLFLSFVHALTRTVRSVESAVFNIDVSFVTDVFRRRALADAMAWLEAQSIVLAGGTMTGHSLHEFTSSLEARGVLRPGTVAMILSDGWDVGDTDLLRSQMRRLRRQVGRVVWLDPHAAATGYAPKVSGLLAAWPYIDDYVDFSGIDSLTELADRMTGRPGARTSHRSMPGHHELQGVLA